MVAYHVLLNLIVMKLLAEQQTLIKNQESLPSIILTQCLGFSEQL